MFPASALGKPIRRVVTPTNSVTTAMLKQTTVSFDSADAALTRALDNYAQVKKDNPQYDDSVFRARVAAYQALLDEKNIVLAASNDDHKTQYADQVARFRQIDSAAGDAQSPVMKGDKPGHAFHGNQYDHSAIVANGEIERAYPARALASSHPEHQIDISHRGVEHSYSSKDAKHWKHVDSRESVDWVGHGDGPVSESTNKLLSERFNSVTGGGKGDFQA